MSKMIIPNWELPGTIPDEVKSIQKSMKGKVKAYSNYVWTNGDMTDVGDMSVPTVTLTVEGKKNHLNDFRSKISSTLTKASAKSDNVLYKNELDLVIGRIKQSKIED